MFTKEMFLQEYFDLKIQLSELKVKHIYDRKNETINTKIKEIEKEIDNILSMYDRKELLEIIKMSLVISV